MKEFILYDPVSEHLLRPLQMPLCAYHLIGLLYGSKVAIVITTPGKEVIESCLNRNFKSKSCSLYHTDTEKIKLIENEHYLLLMTRDTITCRGLKTLQVMEKKLAYSRLASNKDTAVKTQENHD